MQDILDRLEAELTTAPDPTFDLSSTIAAGRRVVRRRRLAVGAAAFSVAAVLGGSAVAVTGGDDPTRGNDRDVAVEPSPTASPTTSATIPRSRDDQLASGELVTYDGQGDVVLRDGWRIVQEVANPLGRAEPARSVGLEITDGSETRWFLLDYSPTKEGPSTFAAADPAGKAFATLDQWIAAQVDLQDQGVGERTFVVFGPDGRLRANPGVEIVEQRTPVFLGQAFAPPARTVVALLDVDGDRWFVAARRLAGSEPEYFPANTPAAGTSLESFIAYSRTQYAEGEGLR